MILDRLAVVPPVWLAEAPPAADPMPFPDAQLARGSGTLWAFHPEKPLVAMCAGHPANVRPCRTRIAPRYAGGHAQCSSCFKGPRPSKKDRDRPLAERWPL